MQIDLSGRTAIVTGAARGIGHAIAAKLAAAGCSVVMADVDAPALEESRASIEGAEIFAGNLTDPDIPKRLVDCALKRFGGLDIVVNNAGYTWDSVIQKTTDEQFQAMLDIHLLTPFRV